MLCTVPLPILSEETYFKFTSIDGSDSGDMHLYPHTYSELGIRDLIAPFSSALCRMAGRVPFLWDDFTSVVQQRSENWDKM